MEIPTTGKKKNNRNVRQNKSLHTTGDKNTQGSVLPFGAIFIKNAKILHDFIISSEAMLTNLKGKYTGPAQDIIP